MTSKPTETELLPERIIDAVANAIMDEMDCINTEQKMFAASLPRDKYLPSMRRYALAAVTAYVRHSPTPSSAEARERARCCSLSIATQDDPIFEGKELTCGMCGRQWFYHNVGGWKTEAVSTPQPTLSDAVQAESDAYARGYQDGSVSQPTLQQAIEKVREMRNRWQYLYETENVCSEWGDKVHTAQQIITALSSLAGTQPDGWLPIESVPRDGSEVFIVFPDGHVQIWKTRLPDDKSFWYEHAPTHWMPLPSPPKEQQ